MSSASDKVNFMEQFMGRQRERGWKDSSYLRYCEEAFVKRMIDNKGKNFEMVASWFTFKAGSTLAIAFSHNGQYMASGHTSRNHEVYVHQLVPKARIFNKLVGHSRTPWCLTFDPSSTCILYSGCLGGVVNRWNIENGTLLGSFSCGMSTPINSIEVVLTNPTHILVATMHVLYLVSGKELQIVWKVEACQGDVLRQVKYLAEANKLMTVLKEWQFPLYHRLQVRDFNITVPPELTFDRGSAHCAITSPQCVATTARNTVFCDKNGVSICSTSEFELHMYQTVLDFKQAVRPKIAFMDISPCEQYLLVGIKEISEMCIVIVDLEKKAPVMKEYYPATCFNCAMWMPPSGAHGMGICLGIGSNAGGIAICSDNKELQCRDNSHNTE